MLSEDDFNLELTDEVIEKICKPRLKKAKQQKIYRCSLTRDFVEEMTGDEYRKPKKGESY
ncbi:MAG: hypothetical protein KBT03_13150 [Bacteroidales bacterium]|nr:hypothetical protein [Candidatus Scybalousia scybalohippi]